MQQPLVANLYNPHEQTKEQLIQSFVVRHRIFRKLFREIKNTDMKYPEQHYLIEGQRGMGKTTLLLRLSYEIENDSELNTWLIPIVLKEEAYYGITRLFKLWETIAGELENKNPGFTGLSRQMEDAYNENKDYERICFDMLISALETHSGKILLFIDNLGEMFKNFNEMESHRLREILMTCPHLRIIGASSLVLEAFFKYEHAFYEFFKKARLKSLNKEETRDLLSELGKDYKKEKAIQSIIENQPGRVETLRILTGGVIRTIILLFEIFTDNQNGSAVGDLEQVLDRVTPLYKHRMDDLIPLQRDVVNAIALNWDAMSVQEIARKIRMKTDEIEAILEELEKVFIIQRTPVDADLHFYHLRERFFNIWYLMRLAPKGSQNKVIWLVRFLESWYDKEELAGRARKHIEAVTRGDYHPKAAYYLTEALAGTCKLDMETEYELVSETKKFLMVKDENLAEELSLSDKELFNKGEVYYESNEYEKAADLFLKIKNQNESVKFRLAGSFYYLKNYEKAEKYYLMAAEKDHPLAMTNLGWLYEDNFTDYRKAEKYYMMALDKGDEEAIFRLGCLYHIKLNDKEKAEKYYLMAAENGSTSAMNNLGWLYKAKFKDKEKAKKYLLMSVEKDQSLVAAMTNLGRLCEDNFADYRKAEKYYMMALDKGDEEAIFRLGYLYHIKLNDKEKAEKYYLMAVENGEPNAMNNLGMLYETEYKDKEKAEKYFLMAVENGEPRAMNNLAVLYFGQKKQKKEALKLSEQAVSLEGIMLHRQFLAKLYLWNDQTDNAINTMNEILHDKTFIDEYSWSLSEYLKLLLVKKQYQHAAQYFETPDLNLKEKFKPLYYAFLHLTDDKNFHKLPPELSEPVDEIIEEVRQMEVDYA
ncbi:tetratricopeptide repeat protein [Desulfococcaceae bacterium HSG8]|nr:tetratricopeptide repeat protein [Desulfococcaceae bacterium HSG8]